MEQFEQIRCDRDREGLSILALAERRGVHRQAVRQALDSAMPLAKRAPRGRGAPKLGEYREIIRRVAGGRPRGAAQAAPHGQARLAALVNEHGVFTTPGIAGAHAKGGVEGEVGRLRRNHLVPVPQVGSIAELNARLLVR